MMPKDPKITNNQINHESCILTSNTNKELKKKIKDISLQVYLFDFLSLFNFLLYF